MIFTFFLCIFISRTPLRYCLVDSSLSVAPSGYLPALPGHLLVLILLSINLSPTITSSVDPITPIGLCKLSFYFNCYFLAFLPWYMHTLHRIRIRLFCPSSTLLFSSVLSFISSNLLHRKPFHNLQRVHLPPRRDLCQPTPIPTCRSVHSHSHTLKPGRRQKFSKTMRRSPSHFIFKVGKRQGGGTLIQSSQLLYDVTILDTLADSYSMSQRRLVRCSDRGAQRKVAKCESSQTLSCSSFLPWYFILTCLGATASGQDLTPGG